MDDHQLSDLRKAIVKSLDSEGADQGCIYFLDGFVTDCDKTVGDITVSGIKGSYAHKTYLRTLNDVDICEAEPEGVDINQSDEAHSENYLELDIEIPEDFPPEKIKELIRQSAMRADATHRANGGHGLKIDLVEVFEDADVPEGVLS